jgi:hypothetical protein
MSRPAPKFAVGQEVLVHSGNVVVGQGIVSCFEWRDLVLLFSGPYSGFVYTVSGFSPPDTGCAEFCLLPKPPLSDQSFDQLLQGLKRPQGVVV